MAEQTNSSHKADVGNILKLLEELYGDVATELHYESPFQLLVATMLSAQTTDRQVNKVTPGLFEKCQGPEDFAAMSEDELGQLIRSCGFYKTKSRNIIKASKMLLEEYNGQVPEDLEQLQRLPGVGRKTANVVVSNAFGQDAIAVDTHVFRVSNRLGLADAKNVRDTEFQLMENIPKDKWSRAHHWLIYHGRRVCNAKKPACQTCTLNPYCKFYKNKIGQAQLNS
jgi:endonuclease-3